MSKKLLLIATGGTIASRPAEDGLTPEMTSEELLQCIPEVRSLCEIDTVQPFNLDSTNMRPQNWVELVKIIREKYESYDGFVITHGTDTMPETARYLLEHADLGNKVVVLTGAMQPAVMARSDAGFNLGAAIAALNLLEPGVYISMSGRIFPAESVRKDRSRGIFEG